jgi:hypothetical protein
MIESFPFSIPLQFADRILGSISCRREIVHVFCLRAVLAGRTSPFSSAKNQVTNYLRTPFVRWLHDLEWLTVEQFESNNQRRFRQSVTSQCSRKIGELACYQFDCSLSIHNYLSFICFADDFCSFHVFIHQCVLSAAWNVFMFRCVDHIAT